MTSRLHISLHGAVQGVGFRPFVYRLATEMDLNGWVLNSAQGVFIEVEGERDKLDKFVVRLGKEKPARAYIQGMETAFLDVIGFTKFEIKESDSAGARSAFVLPDIATCPECTSEIFDPTDRRYLYPFTNCTNCGPRFSITRALPYDRPNTTMVKFEMCDECKSEYSDPTNRRFHAQPNACPKCGPHLELWDGTGSVLASHNAALLDAAEAIRAGKIVALKGVGGFQLLVDARSDDAVQRLRVRKHREEKPFALMYPILAQLRQVCEVSELEERLLLSPEAPIVLVRTCDSLLQRTSNFSSTETSEPHVFTTFARLSQSIAPRNPYLGVMLPYTPLHHILMRQLGFPVVATSGNISDEPICIDEHEALQRLGGIADVFLVHNRPIERQVDDSVARIMAGRIQIVRRARGYAPFPIEIQNLKFNIQNCLAVGGHLKNTVAINSGTNIFISQHIGDLSTGEAYRAFEKVTGDLQSLYEISPTVIVHDIHPDYLSTQFALKRTEEKLGVQHHFAHVAACMAENKLDGHVLGVSWDGTGYGEDGTIWGGEFLITDGSSYDRVATFRPFRLPGSSASIKEPRRTALGLLYEILGQKVFDLIELASVNTFDAKSLVILKKMLESGLNSPITTSAGRLFDAVSSIVGLRQTVSFEGQGAMELEFALDGVSTEETYRYKIIEDSPPKGACLPIGRDAPMAQRPETGDRKQYQPLFIIDWEPMIREIFDDVSSDVSAGTISATFHNTLVEMIMDIAERIGQEKVVISGGCFQNKYLTERTISKLVEKGFKPYWHQRVPPNDGGISLGQMYVAMKSRVWNDGIMERWNDGREKQGARNKRPEIRGQRQENRSQKS